jgi:hypothetical protein
LRQIRATREGAQNIFCTLKVRAERAKQSISPVLKLGKLCSRALAGDLAECKRSPQVRRGLRVTAERAKIVVQKSHAQID